MLPWVQASLSHRILAALSTGFKRQGAKTGKGMAAAAKSEIIKDLHPTTVHSISSHIEPWESYL